MQEDFDIDLEELSKGLELGEFIGWPLYMSDHAHYYILDDDSGEILSTGWLH